MLAGLSAGPAVAAPSGYDYAFAAGARAVDGASDTTDAPLLAPGGTYRDALPRGAELYYRLDLDASSNAYVSVTAVPPADSALTVSEGIRVSVQSADGHSCSFENAAFGAAHSPHPVTAWGARTVTPVNRACEGAGAYYVVVERVGTADASRGDWQLELTSATEPALKAAGATKAPDVWDSATPAPAPAVGEPRRRAGGAGFERATPIGAGVWRTDIAPGQTLYYRVPVGWGQQPHASVELGSSGTDSGYTLAALELGLYNPVRADVQKVSAGYAGSQRNLALAAVAPVDYANRFAGSEQVNGMRFAGGYYLVVHLAARVADEFGAGPYGLTLHVSVEGAERDGPGYAGQSVPRDLFQVTADQRRGAAEGTAAPDDTVMRVLAVGGIGGGTAVVVVLGAWTAVGRRRSAGAV
ncbi:hypothetical protein [Streptomyces sp. NPDC087212]|uniref:hypothetical protein n=1 Tax=Streptomyces sp. NPDC087212 TaxID=3365766 RepID=UPI003812B63D